MKTWTLFPLCALLLPAAPLFAEPPTVLAPHGWSENTKPGDFFSDAESLASEEGMAAPTHTIGVLIPAGDRLVVREVMKDSPAQISASK